MSLQAYLDSLGTCWMWQSYRTGCIRDFSGTGNHGSFVGAPRMEHGKKGHDFRPVELGNILVPDHVSQQGTQGVLILFGDFPGYRYAVGGVYTYISKRAGGVTQWYLYYDQATARLYFDAGVGRFVTPAFTPGDHMMGVVFQSNTLLDFYKNGVFHSAFSGLEAVAAQAVAIEVGSRESAQRNVDHFYDVICLNSVTNAAAVIAEINRRWLLEGVPDQARGGKRIWTVPEDLPGGAAVLRLGRKDGAVIPDISGTGNNATVTGPLFNIDHLYGSDRAVDAYGGTGLATIAPAASINNLPNISYSVWIRRRSTGGGAAGRLFDRAALSVLYDNGGAAWRYEVQYDDPGTAVWTWPITALDQDVHMVLTHAESDPAANPLVYVNGVAVVVTRVVGMAGALTDNSGQALVLANQAAGTTGFDGPEEDFRIYPRILSATEARELYLQGARKVLVEHPRFKRPESVAAVGAGGMVGPWEVLGGTHRWSDDGSKRRIVTVTVGTVLTQCKQAYGSWYFRFKRPAAQGLFFLPVSSSKEVYVGGGTNNSYALYMAASGAIALYRYTAGVQVNTVFIALAAQADNVEYEGFLTRTHLGAWVLWLRGGAYTVWTSVGTGTDNVHSISNWLNFYATLSCEFTLLQIFLGAMTPAEAGL